MTEITLWTTLYFLIGYGVARLFDSSTPHLPRLPPLERFIAAAIWPLLWLVIIFWKWIGR